MISYGYVLVGCSSEHITLISTEPEVVQWFLDEMAKAIPGHRVEVEKCLSGELYRAEVKKAGMFSGCPPKVEAVYAWVVRELCHDGWEPFSEADQWWGGMSFRKRIGPA